MAGSGRVAATAAVLVVLVVAAAAPAPAEGAVTECRQVMSYLISCLGYATGRAASPPTECCSGVRGLNSAAATAADRRTACNCLKQQTGAIGTIRPDLVAGIPSKCGVNIPYPISPSTDCSRVH